MGVSYQIRSPGKKPSFLGRFSVNTNFVLANVILFVVFSILIFVNPNNINSIAIKPSNILQGKYLWTFITSMFMHGGLFHLFANMISLFSLGGLVEKLIGRKRYFWFYMVSGILAGLFFVLSALFFGNLTGDLNTFAVGASGALFGVVGLLMILTPNLPLYLMFIPIPVKMKYAAPGILIILWFISVAADIPIGNTAHLGGLIAGLVYGFYLRKKYKNKTALISRRFS